MAIIVDKIQKRKDIALACKDTLINEGIHNVSISKLTKAAGISKGSFYDYFENKNDLVFEIININLVEHNKIKHEKLESVKTARGKVKVFLQIFYEEENDDLKNLYKEFLSISLSNPTKDILEYHKKRHNEYFVWFESIFKDAIEKGEIKPNAMKLVKGLFIFGNGLFLSQLTCNFNSDDENMTEVNEYIDVLFKYIEI